MRKMSEKLDQCLHDKQFNEIVEVRVTLRCKNCDMLYDVLLEETNLQVVKNELEYEL